MSVKQLVTESGMLSVYENISKRAPVSMNVTTHGEFSHLVTATVPLTEGACEIFFSFLQSDQDPILCLESCQAFLCWPAHFPGLGDLG